MPETRTLGYWQLSISTVDAIGTLRCYHERRKLSEQEEEDR